MNTHAIILDTETHDLHGLPIQIAYMPCDLSQGVLVVDQNAVFDQLFSIPEKINYAAMAVNHIIESDLISKPEYTLFILPKDTAYIIGHNIDYDIAAIAKCGIYTQTLKPICTLALARKAFPDAPKHNLATLSYFLSKDHAKTREVLKNAHDAKTDILITSFILEKIIEKLGIQSIEQLYQVSEIALNPTFIDFGKYKGTALANLPIDYVRWLQRENKDQRLLAALKKLHGEHQ